MIVIYGKPDCRGCTATKGWLERRELEYEYKELEDHPEVLAEAQASGALTAPIVVTDQGDWWAGLRPDKLKGYQLAEQYKAEVQGGLDIPISIS